MNDTGETITLRVHRTINEIAKNVQAGPVLAPTVSLLTPGVNRFGFGLFDRSRKQITDAPGAIYIARDENSPARGPGWTRWKGLPIQVAKQHNPPAYTHWLRASGCKQ